MTARSVARSVSRSDSRLVGGYGASDSGIDGQFTVSDDTPNPGDNVIFTFVPSSVNFTYIANSYSITAPASLVLTATQSLTYQLYKNGVAVSGKTAAVNTISSVSVTDIGSYTLLVTDTVTGNSRVFGPIVINITAFAIGNAIIGSTFQIG